MMWLTLSCDWQMTRDDREKVAVLVVYYGGNYSNTLDASITHLVTMEMTGVSKSCNNSYNEVVGSNIIMATPLH